ncbi:tyrosine-type recombinase/integrase [Brevibacillus invocatus]|uniref:tyrosine-type recombinase/integrase n=1 Tax=Brevibacillus invocatus TaxID=173959 RepID=UPI00203DF110|nr:tyrosine-type recombinase/integrase [Brevibacillus invocatus]MCM3081925.1 tyrosine-type recombinase/integrase [Brevibacillus invocatus]MCM3432331.1 tyrosine-type recombinase/integrase [Brevibacillus invocatus]
MRLIAAADQFIKHLSAAERSQQTISGYGNDLRMFNKYLTQQYNCEPYLEDIVANDIKNYLVWLKEVRNNAPASRSRHFHTLRSFFSYAYRSEWVQRDVSLSVEGVKIPQKERTYLSEIEVKQLLKAIEHSLIQLIVETMYRTGLRVSECLNLTMDTVDLDNKVIHVVAGKGNKDRLVPISSALLPLLQQYVAHERVETPSPYFFATKKTGKVSPVYVNHHLGKATKALGWKKHVTAHILRHSFASQLVKKDVGLVQIQKLLGHSSLKVTSVYTHSNLEQLTQAVNEL